MKIRLSLKKCALWFMGIIIVCGLLGSAAVVMLFYWASRDLPSITKVQDYRPAQVAQDKIKKHDGELSIELERTDDILGWVGEHKPEQLFVCGFSMETKDLIENSTAKLHKKNMDMIVANNVKVPGAGFGVDTNVVTLITESVSTALPLQSKDDVAMHIADVIVEAKRRKQKK